MCVVKTCVCGEDVSFHRGIEGWVRSRSQTPQIYFKRRLSLQFLSFTLTLMFWTQTVCSLPSLTRELFNFLLVRSPTHTHTQVPISVSARQYEQLHDQPLTERSDISFSWKLCRKAFFLYFCLLHSHTVGFIQSPKVFTLCPFPPRNFNYSWGIAAPTKGRVSTPTTQHQQADTLLTILQVTK